MNAFLRARVLSPNYPDVLRPFRRRSPADSAVGSSAPPGSHAAPPAQLQRVIPIAQGSRQFAPGSWRRLRATRRGNVDFLRIAYVIMKHADLPFSLASQYRRRLRTLSPHDLESINERL